MTAARVEMTSSEFERAWRELQREYANRADNDSCVQCDDCRRCTSCTFCRRSEQLVRCHYCVECERSIDSTHCHTSRDLIGCTHCTSSERCSRSAYLERCVDCADCTYCYGCVGLSGREFHILNEPYERSAYFKLTAQLSKQHDARRSRR